jgi:hypothetical protein
MEYFISPILQYKRINSSRYNLSRIYQINENILTMSGLILPLDFCFDTLFLIYFSVAIFLRSSQIAKINFQIGYDWINSVNSQFPYLIPINFNYNLR